MNTDPTVQFGREAEKYLTSAVHADSAALNELVALVNPNGGIVLDIGTGAGHMAFAMSRSVDEVVASDPTPQMLEVTAKAAREKGLTNIKTQLAYAEDLPFGDQHFDGVMSRVAAHHFKDREMFLDEVDRVLKPGGWILLVDTVSMDDKAAADELNTIEAIRDPSHGWNMTVTEWTDAVVRRGMTVESVTSRFKVLETQEWMDRMSVSEADQSELKTRLSQSTGALREYLQPTETTFRLQEMSLFAKKP